MLENTDNHYVGGTYTSRGSSTGEHQVGYVLGVSDDHRFFLVQLTDGTDLTISEHVIGGELLVGYPDVGAPVELVGTSSDEILSGVIAAASGDYEKIGRSYYEKNRSDDFYSYSYHISGDRMAVASGFVVRLDHSGEEVFVPVGSIVAWLEYRWIGTAIGFAK